MISDLETKIAASVDEVRKLTLEKDEESKINSEEVKNLKFEVRESKNALSTINSKLKSAGKLVDALGKVIKEKDKLLLSAAIAENDSKTDIVSLKGQSQQKDL